MINSYQLMIQLASVWSKMDPIWSRVEVIGLCFCDVLFHAFQAKVVPPRDFPSLSHCFCHDLHILYILTSTIINLCLGFWSVPGIHEHLHCQVLSCRKDSPRKWCKWSCVRLCAHVSGRFAQKKRPCDQPWWSSAFASHLRKNPETAKHLLLPSIIAAKISGETRNSMNPTYQGMRHGRNCALQSMASVSENRIGTSKPRPERKACSPCSDHSGLALAWNQAVTPAMNANDRVGCWMDRHDYEWLWLCCR